MGKREQNKIVLKRRVLDILESFTSKKTFEQVKVEDICERVGVSKVTLFKHFSSKEGLLLAWWKHWCDNPESDENFDIRITKLYWKRKNLLVEVCAKMYTNAAFVEPIKGIHGDVVRRILLLHR